MATLIWIVTAISLLHCASCTCTRFIEEQVCQERWNGMEVPVKIVKNYMWDGSCDLPTGRAQLNLFGSGVDCRTCPFASAETVAVNGELCTVKDDGKVSLDERMATARGSTESIDSNSTLIPNVPERKSVDPEVAGLLMSSIPSWTLALIIGLAAITVTLSVLLIILVRFRRNRLYCCTPSLLLTASVELYARSRNPVCNVFQTCASAC